MNGKQVSKVCTDCLFLLVGALCVAATCIFPTPAKAVLQVNGNLDGECAWANVVLLQNQTGTKSCSGTLIAPNAVLTAGHCVDMYRVRFGEVDLASGGGAEIEVFIKECLDHATYTGATFGNPGVDLQVCIIEDEDLAAIEGIPIVPIMVPTGPARDWLQSRIYSTPTNNMDNPEVWAVGSGCNASLCEDDDDMGDKYQINDPARLFNQRGPSQLLGPETSITVLESQKVNGSTTENGDSGGPAFIRMRDGTWRLIGALHDDTHPLEHEAAPAHLAWIEETTGEEYTTTPCHDYNSVTGEWAWTGPCATVFPTDSNLSGIRDWDSNCTGVSTGGGLYSGANTVPSAADDIRPDSGAGNLWVPLSVLDDVYDDTVAMAINGDFGSPPVQQQVADFFIAQAAGNYNHPFVANVYVADKSNAYPTTLLVGDFDGDREEDRIYSDPYHNCGKGRVFEFADDRSVVEWHRDTNGILGTAQCEDHFGASVMVADFNEDGYDDVAVAAPGSTVGSLGQAGSISVLYGSSSGLTESGDQLLDQDSTGTSGTAEQHDFFGHALTAADYNCDGYDDIVIGVPREDIGSAVDAGAFHLIYGSATGLSTVNNKFYQGSGGVNDSPEAGDLFGASVASGNYNGDISSATGNACFDLAVGAPAEDVASVIDAGYIYLIGGSRLGLTASGDQGFSQNSSGVAEDAETGDFFGMNLEVVNDGIYDGLIVQAPGEVCSSTYVAPVGEHRFYGSSGGLATSNDTTSCFDRADEYTMSTMEWGVLTHAADNYAIEVLIAEASN